MIEKITLKNFTVFSDLTIELSPGINVIIGENGTGKTHLLKAAYGLCGGASLFKNKPETSKEELAIALTTKFQRLFMPLDDKLGKLYRQGSNDQAYLSTRQASLSACFTGDQQISMTFFYNSQGMAIQDYVNYEKYQKEAVFFPTKEVLSFMKGFSSLYEKYGLSFDQTYQDICLLLDLPEIREKKMHEKSKWVIKAIESICGGQFVFYGGGKVTFKTKKSEFSANAMAEGFRKMGMLARLLETGAIQPGVTGSLFWDEPEANLNPQLMKILVEIMLELSRNGQQIILTTHDYVLLKWFNLLVNFDVGDRIKFHALSKNGEYIQIQSVDDYLQLSNNTIAGAFNELTKEQVNKKMGDLGK